MRRNGRASVSVHRFTHPRRTATQSRVAAGSCRERGIPFVLSIVRRAHGALGAMAYIRRDAGGISHTGAQVGPDGMRTCGRRRAIAGAGIEFACVGRRAKRKSVQRLRRLRQRALDRVVLRLGILLGEKPASAHRPTQSSEWRRSRIARPARAVSEALRRPMRQWPSPHGAGDGTTSWAIFRPRGCGWWADDLSAGNHKSRAMLWAPKVGIDGWRAGAEPGNRSFQRIKRR